MKLKYYDRFVPTELKVGSNPYKLLQYQQKKKKWERMLDALS